MTRVRQEDEVVSQQEAAKRLGMTNQGLADWAARPGAPVKLQRGRKACLWPQFPVWYRQELIRREKPAGFEEAKGRKMAADAELAELELAERRGDMMPTAVVRAELRTVITRLRAQILAMPSRFAARTVGLESLIASQGAWDAAARDLLQGLADGDGR